MNVFITGYSGSGKSYVAEHIKNFVYHATVVEVSDWVEVLGGIKYASEHPKEFFETLDRLTHDYPTIFSGLREFNIFEMFKEKYCEEVVLIFVDCSRAVREKRLRDRGLSWEEIENKFEVDRGLGVETFKENSNVIIFNERNNVCI